MARTRKPFTKPKNPTKQILQSSKPAKTPKNYPEKSPPPSWAVVISIFTCKHLQVAAQQDQQAKQIQILKPQRKGDKKPQLVQENSTTDKKNKKIKKVKCSGSLCNNTKIMQKPEQAGSSSRSIMKSPVKESDGGVVSLSSHSYSSLSSSSSLLTGSSNSSSTTNNAGSGGGSGLRGMPFRRFSGCYECRMVVDPVLGLTSRDSSLRSTICYCPDCGEIFMSKHNLEAHQAVRHAVSELGPEDTSKNIVEIIFQSSWLKKQAPVCKIDRILKIHNSPKTISNFESYRDVIKSKATKLVKKHPRCIADGNELLRFHSTTLNCSLGLDGSSNLCNSIPSCHICSIIKNGFKSVAGKGILTTATSGKAHDSAETPATEHGGEKRAMLVCRVIAGRVKKNPAEGSVDEYDSVGSAVGLYSNLDELFVFSRKAILPCFVVIYTGF